MLANVFGYASVVGLGALCAGRSTYGGDEEEDGESLLSACHDEGRERGRFDKMEIWRIVRKRGDRVGRRLNIRSN
jgi:hypothetical protein